MIKVWKKAEGDVTQIDAQVITCTHIMMFAYISLLRQFITPDFLFVKTSMLRPRRSYGVI